MKIRYVSRRNVDVSRLAERLKLDESEVRSFLGIKLKLEEADSWDRAWEFYETHQREADRRRVLDKLVDMAQDRKNLEKILVKIPKPWRSLLRRAKLKYSELVEKDLPNITDDWTLRDLAQARKYLDSDVRRQAERRIAELTKSRFKSVIAEAHDINSIDSALQQMPLCASAPKILEKRLRRLVGRKVKSLFSTEEVWKCWTLWAPRSGLHRPGPSFVVFQELAIPHLEKLYQRRLRSVFTLEDAKKLLDDLESRGVRNKNNQTVRRFPVLIRLTRGRLDQIARAHLKGAQDPDSLVRLYSLLSEDSKVRREVVSKLAHHFPKST